MARAGKKDVLAAGGHKMIIAGGIGDGDIFRNVAPEGTRNEETATVEAPKVTKYKFTPLASTILVRRQVVEQKSSLILDTVEQEVPAEGFIVERGPSVTLRVGDHIVFGKYAGTEFKLNGETLLLMEMSDVKGTISPIVGDDYTVETVFV